MMRICHIVYSENNPELNLICCFNIQLLWSVLQIKLLFSIIFTIIMIIFNIYIYIYIYILGNLNFVIHRIHGLIV